MSERVGKIGLNAGTPWSLFAENTAFEDSQGIVLFVAIPVRPERPAYCHLGPGDQSSVAENERLC